MNRIAAVTMVKNEADIIESFARHVLRLADVLYVMDHHSSDETVHILQQLQNEGLPIFLDNYEPEEYRQAEVMTGLMHKAMDEGADLVLPMDADEFLLSARGLAWLQDYLRKLDPRYVYRVQWVEYDLLAPEERGDVFLLARPYGFKCVRDVSKVLMGKTGVQERNLTLTQGNHNACYPNDEGKYIGGFDREVAPDVQIAHFRYRSQAQQQSKDLCMWLSNLSRFTKYTYYARVAEQGFRQFLQRRLHEAKTADVKEKQGDIGRQEMRFAEFASGCDLRYTAGCVDSVANALKLAESLAASYGAVKALFRHPYVSVLLWYDGLEDLRTSLESVCRQSYAPQQVLLLTERQSIPVDAMQLTQQLRDEYRCTWEVGAAGGEVFGQLSQRVTGEYVQWLLPGDRLLPDKLRDMAALLETHEHTRFAASLTIKNEAGCVPNRLTIKAPRNVSFTMEADLLQPILKNGVHYNTNLTGFLFRRRVMEKNAWLRNAFAGERVLYFMLWSECVAEDEIQAFILEPMAKEKEHCWQPDDLLLQQIELGYVLQKLRGSRLLPEEKYRLCRDAYLERAIHEGNVWQGVDSGLLSAYQDLCQEL